MVIIKSAAQGAEWKLIRTRELNLPVKALLICFWTTKSILAWMEKGRWVDNVFVERLWLSVKYECVCLREWVSVAALRDALREYFDMYNYKRPHQALDKLTPYMVHSGKTLHS